MPYTIDATGKACPIPVVLAKQALEQQGSDLTVLVDNPTAVENLKRLAGNKGLETAVSQEGNIYAVSFSGEMAPVPAAAAAATPACSPVGCGTAVFIGKEIVGSGDDTLGYNLMKMFLYTLSQGDQAPASLLFMNGGVKLPAGTEQQVIDSIRAIQERGTEVLVCGTCLNYYGLTEQLQVGTVSNMYDIVERMQQAAKVITV